MNRQLILEGIDKAQRVLARYVMPRAPEMPTIDFWERRAKEREAVINELLGILDNKDFVYAVNAAVAEMQDFTDEGTPAPVCSATASVMSELQRRSAVGLKKYGVSVGDRKDLPLSQWLKHLQEELLDASVYIEKARALDNSGELERLRQENAQLKQDWQQVHNDNLRLSKKLQSVRLVLRE
jgi:hypothetical protein